MKRMQSVGMGAMLAAILWAGCGQEQETHLRSPSRRRPLQGVIRRRSTSPSIPRTPRRRNSSSKGMTPSSPCSIRLMANVAAAGDKAAQAQALYQGAEARLQANVQGRQDLRSSPAMLVGPELDAAITGAIEELRKATTAHQARVARQHIATAGFARFLYLSVMEDLLTAPSREHYDEAYGYLGRTDQRRGRTRDSPGWPPSVTPPTGPSWRRSCSRSSSRGLHHRRCARISGQGLHGSPRRTSSMSASRG